MSAITETLSVPIEPDRAPVRSAVVTAETLASKVFRARNARHLTVTALAKATGMSPKTIRAIEGEDVDGDHKPRTFRSTTLSPLDEFFGWRPNEAYDTWKATAEEEATEHPDTTLIAAQMAEITERLRRVEEQPPWTTELIDACRLLSGEDRARVLDLAYRLGRGV